jgi:Protein of unknown function (DUF4242)
MGKYLAEFYLTRQAGLAVNEIAARAQRAAEQVSAEGVPVAFLQSIYVPEDETWFCLYETESLELVHAAVRRAELSCERIVPAQQIADSRPAASQP